MKSKLFRIVIAVLCLGLLAYAIIRGSHQVYSLADTSQSKQLSSPKFTETATFDGLMRNNDKVYDILSLTPERLQEKDCAT